MIRQGLGLIFASMAAHAASASDILPLGQADNAGAAMHCSALGKGFSEVTGSNACIKISGRISAGPGFKPVGATVSSFGPRIGANAANQNFDDATAASGNPRFETSAEPARIYVGVGRDADPRWVVDGQ